ncbi:MAG: ACT domain-containing protein [Holophagaceae bacterium]
MVRLAPGAEVPAWALAGSLQAVTRTPRECSLVCAWSGVPDHERREGPFRALEVEGPLDFALTGILSALLAPLAEAGISVFALSTFDTDYVLVRAECLEEAVAALAAAGHAILAP